MNDAGVVVGMSWPHQTNKQAVAWENGQITRVLPVPDSAIGSAAYDINNLGEIVGYYQTADLWRHACLWDADGTLHDLGSLVKSGSTLWLNIARDTNDCGQISVWGENKSGYVLTPVIPERVTSLLFAGSVLAGLSRLRRRLT